jgi:hypothetical protein
MRKAKRHSQTLHSQFSDTPAAPAHGVPAETKPAHETTRGNRSNVNGCVADIHPGPLDSFITRRIFRRLVRSAYTESELRSFLSETGFQSASIRAEGIGFEV